MEPADYIARHGNCDEAGADRLAAVARHLAAGEDRAAHFVAMLTRLGVTIEAIERAAEVQTWQTA